ncbi:MAG: dockerin type I repeat-containing protein, partial [Clostridiales bacterium]|nr:dockerin type I repeat-containing protein [Clostridiales bacterium]
MKKVVFALTAVIALITATPVFAAPPEVKLLPSRISPSDNKEASPPAYAATDAENESGNHRQWLIVDFNDYAVGNSPFYIEFFNIKNGSLKVPERKTYAGSTPEEIQAAFRKDFLGAGTSRQFADSLNWEASMIGDKTLQVNIKEEAGIGNFIIIPLTYSAESVKMQVKIRIHTDGNYDFLNYKTEDIFLTSSDWYTPGDINGDGKVTVQDLLSLRKYISGHNFAGVSSRYSADTNGDGKVNEQDTVLMNKFLS